jgi:hypothetical protein
MAVLAEAPFQPGGIAGHGRDIVRSRRRGELRPPLIGGETGDDPDRTGGVDAETAGGADRGQLRAIPGGNGSLTRFGSARRGVSEGIASMSRSGSR